MRFAWTEKKAAAHWIDGRSNLNTRGRTGVQDVTENSSQTRLGCVLLDSLTCFCGSSGFDASRVHPDAVFFLTLAKKPLGKVQSPPPT